MRTGQRRSKSGSGWLEVLYFICRFMSRQLRGSLILQAQTLHPTYSYMRVKLQTYKPEFIEQIIDINIGG